jgi:hypothetical protein
VPWPSVARPNGEEPRERTPERTAEQARTPDPTRGPIPPRKRSAPAGGRLRRTRGSSGRMSRVGTNRSPRSGRTSMRRGPARQQCPSITSTSSVTGSSPAEAQAASSVVLPARFRPSSAQALPPARHRAGVDRLAPALDTDGRGDAAEQRVHELCRAGRRPERDAQQLGVHRGREPWDRRHPADPEAVGRRLVPPSYGAHAALSPCSYSDGEGGSSAERKSGSGSSQAARRASGSTSAGSTTPPDQLATVRQ